MSKVKNGYKNPHEKSKLRRNLRRKETIFKKNTRRKNAENNVYHYGRGYYIEHGHFENEYGIVEVPEKKIPIIEYFKEDYFYYDYDLCDYCWGYVWKERIIGYKIIPSHKKRVKVRSAIWVETPNRLTRVYIDDKKYFKNQSNRKIRRDNKVYQNGEYKKVYDVAWSIY